MLCFAFVGNLFPGRRHQQDRALVSEGKANLPLAAEPAKHTNSKYASGKGRLAEMSLA
jgi:hypothetical protein